MLNPTTSADRINYGTLILPERGYHLVKAIGTTYSLDFETLVAIAIKLGLIHDADDDIQDDLSGILAAFSKVSDRMLIFCEAGQIKKIKNAKPVFLLMEKMVIPVALEQKNEQGRFASFHPKFWLLQYANEAGAYKYRLVVLSRNLTIDHSWDIAISLDSSKEKKKDENTVRIQYFLGFLSEQLSKESKHYNRQMDMISQLINDISDVSFELDNDIFDGYEFLPIGIGKHSININDLFFKNKVSEMMVISPFISKKVIERLSDNCETYNLSLITRKTEISKIASDNGFDFNVYVVRDDVINGESGISEFSKLNSEDSKEEDNKSDEMIDYLLQDIHAKVYLFNDENTTKMYLGSMNASYNSMNYNVETLMGLNTTPDILDYSDLYSSVIGNEEDKNCPFERVDLNDFIPDEGQDKTVDLQLIIKEICRLKRKAYVVLQEDGLYTVNVEFEEFKSDCSIQISPFLCKTMCDLSTSFTFSDLHLINLSEFYTISISSDDQHLERVITIQTEGIPDAREKDIVRSVIRDSKQFIEYISFLLDEDYIRALYEKRQLSNSGFYQKNNLSTAVYEKMLRSASEDPRKIEDIQTVIDMLDGDESIIPKEFAEMYNTFCRVLNLHVEKAP